ncbi:SCO family protein [Zobellella sp. DQSA1]|uniref:SCO family protein n=1 Tax=Zobellella sp. DQSA1 TaxID=3342386 RepID=UPI0035BEB689
MKPLLLLIWLTAFNLQAALPGDSVYQLDASWHNSQGERLQLQDLAGKKQLLGFIYTDCTTACPLIVANLQALQQVLTPAQQAELGFVLVSLTPGRDTPKVMRHFAEHRGLDQHWTLLSGTDDEVRRLAMALNIQYMGQADGEISHSNAITVLDEQGRLLVQQVGLPDGARGLVDRLFSR